MLLDLPPEILVNITSLLSSKDLSSLRLVSSTLRFYCDNPSNWRSIYLEPPSNQIWKLIDLKLILHPHLSHIQSIHIWGVRDSIVRYILSFCVNLKHLTVCGWTTLSDHSLHLEPTQLLDIRSIKFIGLPKQTNYVSIDAQTLGKFIIQSPQLNDLVLGCQLHVHADTLISELEKSIATPHLKSFTLASRQTWKNEHIVRFIRIYPSIEKIQLLPDASHGFNNIESFNFWITQKVRNKL
jgi:hypothetical protein